MDKLPQHVAPDAPVGRFVQPADVIKSKVQTDSHFSPAYRGMVDCGRRVWRAEGLRGLFRGFGPCLARSVPANAVAFLTFELVRKRLGGNITE